MVRLPPGAGQSASGEADWPFTFINLQFDTDKAEKLITEIGNPLILPVLDDKGTLYEKPPLTEIDYALELSRWRRQNHRTYYGKSKKVDECNSALLL